MIANYSPGLHKLVTLEVIQTEKLTNSSSFVSFTELLLSKHALEKVGISIHNFENKSFTIAICLKESHICIHTWPEYNQLTLDVYLCNYIQDNSKKVKDLMTAFIQFFDATIITNHEIYR